jgi:2-keto-4-pentenoate hydratase/2-oxohepta-3-ene-1,7-dioic acid hydratase in catechol pathway
MQLFRFRQHGQPKIGVVYQGQHVDVSAFGEDYNEQFFATNGLLRLGDWLRSAQPSVLSEKTIDFDSPIARPSKIICIGLNYADHAREAGMELPKEPVVFFKATTALCGPNDDLIIPRGSTKTDWEVELAVVIGKKASYVAEADALQHVAGYCLHNDYSERAFQLERGGQWVKGKSCDTFAPLGPYLVTPDEVGDPHQLPMWLTVNGTVRQKSNTNQLVFGIVYLIHYLSQFMTLLPGDVISTGTPAGVGLGFKPPVYLQPGDVVELGIDKLGRQRQVAKAYAG